MSDYRIYAMWYLAATVENYENEAELEFGVPVWLTGDDLPPAAIEAFAADNYGLVNNAANLVSVDGSDELLETFRERLQDGGLEEWTTLGNNYLDLTTGKMKKYTDLDGNPLSSLRKVDSDVSGIVWVQINEHHLELSFDNGGTLDVIRKWNPAYHRWEEQTWIYDELQETLDEICGTID